jgi:hypothetical protein
VANPPSAVFPNQTSVSEAICSSQGGADISVGPPDVGVRGPLGSHISDITHILVVGQDYFKITYQELDKHQVS